MNNFLGDYAVVKKLGNGSLGETFLAQHRFLKRPYALKVLPEDLASDPSFLARFEREVMALASLEHPHIVKMHNVSSADGKFFLVTDCILDERGDALNLGQYIQSKGGKLEEEEILKIAQQIASALDYAHAKASGDFPFSHRGLKLSNILVGKKKDGVHVYLCDFGLTRVLGHANALTRTYKAVSETVGQEISKLPKLHISFLQNYLFLAPEQKVAHETAAGDAKADVYAFGVLVYFLLMNRFPEGFFEFPKGMVYNWERLLKSCLQSEPEKRPVSLLKALEEIAPGAKYEEEQVEEQSSLKPVLKPSEIARPEFIADPGAIFQVEPVVAKYQPQQEEHTESEPLMSEMAVIRAGTYLRGSNDGGRDEMPRHRVDLDSFAIDICPVTNEQFVRFLETMGGEKDHNNNDIIRLRESRIKRSGGKLTVESGYARHPVVGVSWYGAVAYAKWVGKRLPTEAEWEVAAAGGLDECLYPTGKNIERTQANFFSSDTTTVMSYPSNGYGLYDMAGNVYEWCQDWYDYHYYDKSKEEPDNPKGPHQGVYRVLRGGCWKSLKEDLRCAHRHRNNPGTVNATYGFRCCADVAS